MRKSSIFLFCVALLLSMAGCAGGVENDSVYRFPGDLCEIAVTCYAGGEVTTELFQGENTAEILDWYAALELQVMEEAPEAVEGNEAYTFAVDGAEAFSYDWRGSEAYLSIGDDVYEVRNPTRPPAGTPAPSFLAAILEIGDGSFLVEPIEDGWEKNSSDRFEVPIEHMDPSPEPEVGDVLKIVYNGTFQESYPARISEVFRIEVVQEASLP